MDDFGGAEEQPVPLRLVVARCLEEWGVTSTDSEDSDDFCGWRVGSRELVNGRPVRSKGSRSSSSSAPATSYNNSAAASLRRLSAASLAALAERRAAASRLVAGLTGSGGNGGTMGGDGFAGLHDVGDPSMGGPAAAQLNKKSCAVQ